MDRKDILRKNQLPVSGKKADLISRIEENIAKSDLKTRLGNHAAHYTLSARGEAATCPTQISITKDTDFEDRCLAAIHKKDIGKACGLVAAWESAKRFPRGIGTDWNEEAQKGLTAPISAFYTRILEGAAEKDEPYRECLVLAHMLGEPDPSPLIKRLCGTVDVRLLMDLQYEQRESKALMDMETYHAMGVSMYEILGTKDGRACPRCRKMNGKRYPISDAQIGITFPPFCKECRCTTVPYVKGYT